VSNRVNAPTTRGKDARMPPHATYKRSHLIVCAASRRDTDGRWRRAVPCPVVFPPIHDLGVSRFELKAFNIPWTRCQASDPFASPSSAVGANGSGKSNLFHGTPRLPTPPSQRTPLPVCPPACAPTIRAFSRQVFRFRGAFFLHFILVVYRSAAEVPPVPTPATAIRFVLSDIFSSLRAEAGGGLSTTTQTQNGAQS